MTTSIDASSLLKNDPQNMYEVLKNFPTQVRQAIDIGAKAAYFHNKDRFRTLVFSGMGGSAIGGDLIRCALQGYGVDDFAMIVNRSYNLPAGVDAHTAFIASSYSGNTEETIASYRAASTRTQRRLCIATGGELARLATAENTPLITIPSGLQPRCAVGYSFFPVMLTLALHGAMMSETRASILHAIHRIPKALDALAEQYCQPNPATNPAFALAQQLKGTIPVFYSPPLLEAVNLRWRGQIQENAKQVAFGNIVPEMNHNEINGWVMPNELMKHFTVVFLGMTQLPHARINLRFEAMRNILKPKVHQLLEINAEGETFLEQMFMQVMLADWTSYWLALLNGLDPSEIPDILALKDYMTEKG
ncbi:MAG: bifunctional phosphoglucose/phosphomannose isomerase [Candidatus Kapaibacterium sp.]|nr:MAG: bifunctional phosphoglucose/phosphomannose isomerase [Candidatus Kapabacteria bacterium]